MDKRVIPDGEPVSMSEFRLGEPYTSEDLCRDFHPGGRVSVVKDGVVYTDTVSSVNWGSGEYVPAPERTWWQKVLRAVTPKRWRKPLPQPTRTLGTVSVTVGAHAPNPLERHQNVLADLQRAVNDLSK